MEITMFLTVLIDLIVLQESPMFLSPSWLVIQQMDRGTAIVPIGQKASMKEAIYFARSDITCRALKEVSATIYSA
jgi:hypothetical protein